MQKSLCLPGRIFRPASQSGWLSVKVWACLRKEAAEPGHTLQSFAGRQAKGFALLSLTQGYWPNHDLK